MDVQLYVYDLSRGLARQMSMAFLGTQIDAVYHTSLVFGGIEYFFGAGIQTSVPGGTHHGRPMEVVPLGKTELPMEVILEYLESLRAIYTMESYDLFLHNCNNFSNDFAMFLVGNRIPDHITSLPRRVLDTPFGQMLKPQLDQAMRGVTQAPVPSALAETNGIAANTSSAHIVNTTESIPAKGRVQEVAELPRLLDLLEKAKHSCAAIFFTSSTCAPCKICYPVYDELAEEFEGKATLVKVDINFARDIAAQYRVRTTPTFMTFLNGSKLEEWAGADPSKLRGNIRLLVQMAHPPHLHSQLHLPSLQGEQNPIKYSKGPPIEKLLAKLDPSQSSHTTIQSLKYFIEARNASSTAASAPIPDLYSISAFIRSSTASPSASFPPFPLIDLLRLSLVDARVSGYFVEEKSETSLIFHILTQASSLPTTDYFSASTTTPPYPFLLTTTQALANLFTTPIAPRTLLEKDEFRTPLLELISNILPATSAQKTSQETSLRGAAASLAFNVAATIHNQRSESEPGSSSGAAASSEIMDESAQVELVASLAESLGTECQRKDEGKKVSAETAKVLLLAVGLLAYRCPPDGEVRDLLRAVEARAKVEGLEAVEGLRRVAQEVRQVVV